MLKQEQESTALTIGTSGSTTDSVDVIFWIIWGIKLNDPINLREIKATLSDICTEEYSSLSLTEFEVS